MHSDTSWTEVLDRYTLPASQQRSGQRSEAGDDDRSDVEEAAPARILVVEDDWFIGQDIEAALRGAGYDVLPVVVSADEAVTAAGEHSPELVLMDIRLVGLRDGVDAALEIRRRFDISCLFISAYGDPALRTRAAPARPAGWLTKPLAVGAIVAAVRRTVGR